MVDIIWIRIFYSVNISRNFKNAYVFPELISNLGLTKIIKTTLLYQMRLEIVFTKKLGLSLYQTSIP